MAQKQAQQTIRCPHCNGTMAATQTPTAFSAEEHEALMAVPAATVNAAAVWNYTR